MVCEFEDYLAPLAENARVADTEVLDRAVVSVYVNILDFSWKARCVFVDVNGEQRKCDSFRAFIRQHWDPFEAEFVSIKEQMQHHLHVLQYIVQVTHFSAFRYTEQSRCDPLSTCCVGSRDLSMQGRKDQHSSHGSQISISKRCIRLYTQKSIRGQVTG